MYPPENMHTEMTTIMQELAPLLARGERATLKSPVLGMPYTMKPQLDLMSSPYGAAREALLDALGLQQFLLLAYETEFREHVEADLLASGWKAPGKHAGGPRNANELAFLQWLWDFWLDIMNYRDRNLRLGKERTKIALARLREGHTIGEFQEILEWASRDAWMMGQAPKSTRAYNDFADLFGSDKFDRYLTKARTGHFKPQQGRDLMLNPKAPEARKF